MRKFAVITMTVPADETLSSLREKLTHALPGDWGIAIHSLEHGSNLIVALSSDEMTPTSR